MFPPRSNGIVSPSGQDLEKENRTNSLVGQRKGSYQGTGGLDEG